MTTPKKEPETVKVPARILPTGDFLEVFANVGGTITIRASGDNQRIVTISPRDVPYLCRLLKQTIADCDEFLFDKEDV